MSTIITLPQSEIKLEEIALCGFFVTGGAVCVVALGFIFLISRENKTGWRGTVLAAVAQVP